jgi:hypothetical protein
MYNGTQTHIWLVPYLKEGCWYSDCRKTICPIEEEDLKKACEQADSKGAALGSDHGEE